MINQQLLDYIKQGLAQGISKEEIKNALISRGWPKEDIELAFEKVTEPINESISSPQPANIISTRLFSTGELLRKTFDLYKQKFLTLFGIAVISSAISIILLLLVIKILPTSHLSVFAYWIILFLASGFIGLIEVVSQIALIYALKEDKISIIQAYRNSLANILNVIWIDILLLSIIFSIPLVFIILGFTIKTILIPMFLLSAFLLLIPGLIFSLWFIFSNYVLVIENTKGIKALMRSREYAKGQVNNIFSREFSVGFLAFIALLILYFILLLLKIPNTKGIITFIGSILVLPFNITFLYLLYLNIKTLKANQIPLEKPKEQFLFMILAGIGLTMIIFLPFQIIPYLSSELQSMRNKAQEMQITSMIQALKTGVEYYAVEKGKYPQSLDELFAAYPELFSSKPIDPTTNKQYYYEVMENGQAFKLCSGFGTPQENCITSQ